MGELVLIAELAMKQEPCGDAEQRQRQRRKPDAIAERMDGQAGV